MNKKPANRFVNKLFYSKFNLFQPNTTHAPVSQINNSVPTITANMLHQLENRITSWNDDVEKEEDKKSYINKNLSSSRWNQIDEAEKKQLDQFVQCLIDANVLSAKQRLVKRKLLIDLVRDWDFHFDQPIIQLTALGYVESIDLKTVVFSKKIFDVFSGFRLRVPEKIENPWETQSEAASNCDEPNDEIVQQSEPQSSTAESIISSTVHSDLKTDEPPLVHFVKYLMAENILTIDSTNVKRGVFKEIMDQQRYHLNHDELLAGLYSSGYVTSESRRYIVFSQDIFEQPEFQIVETETDFAELTESEEQTDYESYDETFETESHVSSESNVSDHSASANVREEIIKWLVQKEVLTKNKCVKRKALERAIQSPQFMWDFTYDDLCSAWLASGYIDSVSRMNVTFSDKIFNIKSLVFPLVVKNIFQGSESDIFINDCLYESDDEETMDQLLPTNDLIPNETSDPEKLQLLELKIDHYLTFSRPANRQFLWHTNSCIVCRQSYLVQMQLQNHMREVHGDEFHIPEFITKGNLTSQLFEMVLISRKRTETNILFSIKNNFFVPLLLSKVFYVCSNQYIPIPIDSNKAGALIINVGESFEFGLNREMFAASNENHSILLVFEDELEYIEQYQVTTLKAMPQLNLIDKSSYTHRVLNPLRMKPLNLARPSKEMINLYNNFFHVNETDFTELEIFICNTVRSLAADDPKTRMTSINYTDYLSKCVGIADCGQERQMMLYDRQQKVPIMANGYYRIDFADKGELPPDLLENDLLVFRKIHPCGNYSEPIGLQVLGSIVTIAANHLVVNRISNRSRIEKNTLYNIRFKDNRIPIRMELQALKVVDVEKLSKFFFPSSVPDEKEMTITNFEWFNPSVNTNPEQMQAVKHIVNGTAFPSPYIIFGPPGTGKTMTLVETVCQLWKLLPSSRVLISAQSNAACDEITKRLLKMLPPSDIYRLYSPSFERKLDQVDVELQEISNLKTGKHQYPSYSEFYGYRIVVCTLVTSGRLYMARINRRHFKHVFIDECASATEPSSLIPLAGIITAKQKIYGNIILAGDIQQLGPILKTYFAVRLGYDKPLMERLMELPIYQKDPVTKKYNPNLITKLISSFRSHPRIIEFSNKTFYDGDLLAKGLPEHTHWAMNWRYLPKNNFPVIFVPCYGLSKKDDITCSTYNDAQILIVIKYIRIMLKAGINRRKIEQSHIGIISPYKKQCLRIAQVCRGHKWHDIEVGTVETFQGREKPIIIISTVKSGTDNVGFLDNPKRLNVTITRAKALMIIIGNPETLKYDPYWYDLLAYCQSYGGCVSKFKIGCRPPKSYVIRSTMTDFNYHTALQAKNQDLHVEDFL